MLKVCWCHNSQRCKNLKNHKKRENGFLRLTKSFMNLIPRGSSKLLLTTCCSRVCGIAEGLRYLLVGLWEAAPWDWTRLFVQVGKQMGGHQRSTHFWGYVKSSTSKEVLLDYCCRVGQHMWYGTIFAYPKPQGTLRDRVFEQGDVFTEVAIHDVLQMYRKLPVRRWNWRSR